MLVLCWGMLYVSHNILLEKANDNLQHIPENARFVMRLDSRELIKKSLFSVFLESKDVEAVNLIQESFTKRLQKSKAGMGDGIDYLSDIILFEVPFEHDRLLGVLVNLKDEEAFQKQFSRSEYVFAFNNKVGVIFIDQIELQKKQKAVLQKYAQKIVSNSNNMTRQHWNKNRNEGQFFNTESQIGFWTKNTYFGHSNTFFSLQNRSLELSGNFDLNQQRKKEVRPVQYIIHPDGLHFSSAMLPQTVNDSLQIWFNKYAVSLPTIQQISLNYKGLKFESYSDGFSIVPQIELVLTFDKPTSIKDLLLTTKLSDNFNYKVHTNFIAFQHERLYFKQLNQYSCYIGVSAIPNISSTKKELFLAVQGSLDALVTVNGGGLMSSFLEMLPLYLASKNLANSTDFIDIQLQKKSETHAQLTGELRFKKDAYPMNELIKFLLVSQLVE